ncbi:nitroreductase family protein [Pseudonocardia benzenivorans]|uniref:Nitroreductase n=2 Tax=Pseudonocardia TaxID=1847 RepID=F4CT68_PSEUX|nr:nitroreductase family protein [Pseudonocardia dioxanivorans]AEA26286.1 nitroreductase [Pseudonocardia dioxanivorans CB1190]GJF03240.1 oxidoreductase [Pseudonocardia sp. D17]
MSDLTTDPDALPVLEALHTTPARRYLSTDPVPDEVVWSMLDAAVRGPSGGNSQGWGWVVVTDPDVKKRVAGWYRENWNAVYGSRRAEILAQPPGTPGLSRNGFLGAEHLAEHLEDAPLWIFPVLRGAAGATDPMIGASIYGAVQNLCLAARAHGLGTSLTTLYRGHEDELRELLGLPDDALTMALVPIGRPVRGRWAQPRRRPVEEVVHWDRWGATRPREGR